MTNSVPMGLQELRHWSIVSPRSVSIAAEGCSARRSLAGGRRMAQGGAPAEPWESSLLQDIPSPPLFGGRQVSLGCSRINRDHWARRRRGAQRGIRMRDLSITRWRHPVAYSPASLSLQPLCRPPDDGGLRRFLEPAFPRASAARRPGPLSGSLPQAAGFCHGRDVATK